MTFRRKPSSETPCSGVTAEQILTSVADTGLHVPTAILNHELSTPHLAYRQLTGPLKGTQNLRSKIPSCQAQPRTPNPIHQRAIDGGQMRSQDPQTAHLAPLADPLPSTNRKLNTGSIMTVLRTRQIAELDSKRRLLIGLCAASVAMSRWTGQEGISAVARMNWWTCWWVKWLP